MLAGPRHGTGWARPGRGTRRHRRSRARPAGSSGPGASGPESAEGARSARTAETRVWPSVTLDRVNRSEVARRARRHVRDRMLASRADKPVACRPARLSGLAMARSGRLAPHPPRGEGRGGRASREQSSGRFQRSMAPSVGRRPAGSPQPGVHRADDPRDRAAGDRGLGSRARRRPDAHDRIDRAAEGSS